MSGRSAAMTGAAARPMNDIAVPEPAPMVERAPRRTTILLVGRLVTDQGDWVCRVRNLSSTGLMVDCDAALTVGGPVRIELRNMTVLEGEIVWAETPRAGIRFLTPVDVDDLLRTGSQPGRRRPRAPRLTATCPVLVWHLGQTSVHTLVDVSQSGCRLSLPNPPPVGWPVRITIPGLPPRHATLRWAHGGDAGFAFREVLSFTDLSAWQADPTARFVERG